MCSKTRTKPRFSFEELHFPNDGRNRSSAHHESRRFNGRKCASKVQLVYVRAWTHLRYGDDGDTILISRYYVLGADENDGERNSWTSGIFPINRAAQNYVFQYRSTDVFSEPANTVTVRCSSRLRILNTTVARIVYYYYYYTLYA